MRKWIVGILILLLIGIPSFGFTASGKATKIVEFEWEQGNTELPQLAGWVVYGSATSGTGYVKIKDIQYSPITPAPSTTETTFSAKVTVTVAGTVGVTVKRYYVFTAKNIIDDSEYSGSESEFSNEVEVEFKPMPTPSNLNVKPKNLQIN